MSRQDEMRAALLDLLRRVRAAAGPSFSGVGVLVSDHPDRLPLAPLHPSIIEPGGDLTTGLAETSRWESEGHDGFHVISSDFHLLRLSQFLAPPIPSGTRPDPSRPFGARYLAARLGSALPDVLMAGVASTNIGLAIFEAGAERLFEPPA